MANITTSKLGGTGGLSSGFARSGEPIRILLDVADVIAKNGAALASGDTIALVDIPAHTKVIIDRVYFYTDGALGTSGEFELGDAADDDRFVASQTTLTAGTEATIVSTMNTVGFTYAAAAQLRAKVANSGGTITSGKIWIVFRMLDVSAPTAVAGAF